MKVRCPNLRGGKMREVQEGCQTITDFCILKVHEIGARRLDTPTHEVASCKKCKKEVKPSLTFVSQRFMR